MRLIEASATRVFISYSRADKEFAARLKAALLARGYIAFLDTEQISGGERWRTRLKELILNADVMAFVVSPDSILSKECDWETRLALELGKRLIPILWRPIQAEEPPPQLVERNYILFDDAAMFEESISDLCAACDVDISWVRDHTRFVELATRWEATGRPRESLLRGRELALARDWISARVPRAPQIPNLLQDFIAASEQDETRARVATIVAIDVVGFIDRFDGPEARKIEDLRRRIERVAVSHGGRMFNPEGNGFWLEFSAAGEAHSAIQEILDRRAQWEPAIRVGAHVGDVIGTTPVDLMGQGVDVAAHLLKLAEPGTALVSSEFRELVRSRPIEGPMKDQRALTFEILSRRQRNSRFLRGIVLAGIVLSMLAAGFVWLSPTLRAIFQSAEFLQ